MGVDDGGGPDGGGVAGTEVGGNVVSVGRALDGGVSGRRSEMAAPRPPFGFTLAGFGHRLSSGGVNGMTGWPFSAAVMNFCQMIAGYVPPYTGLNSPTWVIQASGLSKAWT